MFGFLKRLFGTAQDRQLRKFFAQVKQVNDWDEKFKSLSDEQIQQKTQEFRDEQKEMKIKQVISMLIKNATDQNNRPYTEERLKNAMNEIHHNFDSRPAEKQ